MVQLFRSSFAIAKQIGYNEAYKVKYSEISAKSIVRLRSYLLPVVGLEVELLCETLALLHGSGVLHCLPSKSNVLILLKNYLLDINISTLLFEVYFSLFCLSVFLSVFLFVMFLPNYQCTSWSSVRRERFCGYSDLSSDSAE